jgi:starch phosphorylase
LKSEGRSLETALESIAASTVFTTHTPVPAGHDHFPQDLMMSYLGSFAHDELGLDREVFLGLGCLPQDSPDFNMTTLAVKGARHLNGLVVFMVKFLQKYAANFGRKWIFKKIPCVM